MIWGLLLLLLAGCATPDYFCRAGAYKHPETGEQLMLLHCVSETNLK